jgi:hypothetical protein
MAPSASRRSASIFLVLSIVATVAAQAGVTDSLYINPLDAKLKRSVDAQNAKLPTMVAPTLRQEKVSAMNGVLTNTYTVIDKTGAELGPMRLEETQRPYIFPSICKAPDTGRMIREGVSFRYVYLGKDGKLGGQVLIIPADCQGQ